MKTQGNEGSAPAVVSVKDLKKQLLERTFFLQTKSRTGELRELQASTLISLFPSLTKNYME